MLGSVRELARILLSFAETRARLAATELEEQVVRLVEILVWIAAALFCLWVALVFGAILVVLLMWDSNRLLAAGLVGALFLGASAIAALIAIARLRERPKFLAATLAELKQDGERIACKP
jgi:uncharacterized membrane protein YqjE